MISVLVSPGESELPVLCETFHQRVADIFNNLQLAGLGRGPMGVSRWLPNLGIGVDGLDYEISNMAIS